MTPGLHRLEAEAYHRDPAPAPSLSSTLARLLLRRSPRMTIRFIPVADIHDPRTVTLGLSGASGTGKTCSALLVARGLAEAATGRPGAPIGHVDTENRRALHYKQAFAAHRGPRRPSCAGRIAGLAGSAGKGIAATGRLRDRHPRPGAVLGP
ncbi:MAG: hypothetical protein ACXIUV_11395 [Alkalilacustris sp.]